MNRFSNEILEICKEIGLLTLDANQKVLYGPYAMQILKEFKEYWLKSTLKSIPNSFVIDKQVSRQAMSRWRWFSAITVQFQR